MVRVEIGVLNRRYLACQISAIKPVPAIFLRSSLRIASKVNQSGWAGFSITGTSPRSAKKNHQVCPHQSVAKITCDFRWRSNSLRSSYKMPGVSPA